MFWVKEAKQTGQMNPILDPRWDPGFGWAREWVRVQGNATKVFTGSTDKII